MTLPIVAIIGRPNVGKSRLFNRLTGRSKAIVDDTSGVTRDRHYGYADWRGKTFVVVDTGGLIPGTEEPLTKKVWDQTFLAIQEADLILCLFDGQNGLTAADEILLQELRRIDKPILYLVNKVDVASQEKMLFDFMSLGLEPLIAVSAEHGRGVSDLLEAMLPHLKGELSEGGQGPPSGLKEGVLRLAIVGRPNVGKSTLINQLAKEERVIVHEAAGTTRDCIDVTIERGAKKYVFVDTAGIKKKRATRTRLEKFSVIHSLKAIDHSQLVLLLIDGLEGLTHQDLHLAHYVWEGGKGLLILINKWDLIKASQEKYKTDLTPHLGELKRVPLLCLSAKTGFNCNPIWDWLEKIEQGRGKRVETSTLNTWLEDILSKNPPPSYKGREVRIYYGTQVGVAPPHFVLFTNEPRPLRGAYVRYLKHQLETYMESEGLPIRLSFRRRSGKR